MMNASDSVSSKYSSLPFDNNSDTENERNDETQGLVKSLTGSVQSWSVEDVINWFQKNVHFGSGRLNECLQIFEREQVTGKTLLSLKRSHSACFGMSDVEWILFQDARRQLIDEFLTHENTRKQSKPPLPLKSATPGTSRLSNYSRSQSTVPSKTNKVPSLLRLFSASGVHWGLDTKKGKADTPKGDQNNILQAEIESLREEIVTADERETRLQAQLEHLDELLKSAKLAGYLYTRTRWLALPGEPPIDDTDVNDWVQKFVVLHGSCILFYLRSTDINPQDSITLEEIVEAQCMPDYKEEYGDTCWYTFQITSCHGVRFECSTQYKFQVDSWLTAIKMESNGSPSL